MLKEHCYTKHTTIVSLDPSDQSQQHKHSTTIHSIVLDPDVMVARLAINFSNRCIIDVKWLLTYSFNQLCVYITNVLQLAIE